MTHRLQSPISQLVLSVAGACLVWLTFSRWIIAEAPIFGYVALALCSAQSLGFAVGIRGRGKGRTDDRMCYAVALLVAFLGLDHCRKALYAASILLSDDDNFIVHLRTISDDPFTSVAAFIVGLTCCFLLLLLLFELQHALGRVFGRAAAGCDRRRVGALVLLSILASSMLAWGGYGSGCGPAMLVPIIVLVLTLLSMRKGRRPEELLLLLFSAVLPYIAENSVGSFTMWTPLAKIDFRPTDGGVNRSINGYPAVPLKKQAGEAPDLAEESDDVTLQLSRKLDSVLIIGQDYISLVASARLRGAKRITVMHPDMELARAQNRLHPDRPLTSAEVRFVGSDGRVQLSRLPRNYDLIVLRTEEQPLINPLLLTEAFQYFATREGLQELLSHLAPSGRLLWMVHTEKPYELDRAHRTLGAVAPSGTLHLRVPVLIGAEAASLFVVGEGDALRVADDEMRFRQRVNNWLERYQLRAVEPTEVATAAWPFLGNSSRLLPLDVYLFGLLLLGVNLYGIVRFGRVDLAPDRAIEHVRKMLEGGAIAMIVYAAAHRSALQLGNGTLPTWLCYVAVVVSAWGGWRIARPTAERMWWKLCSMVALIPLASAIQSSALTLGFPFAEFVVYALLIMPILFGSAAIFCRAPDEPQPNGIAAIAEMLSGAALFGYLSYLSFSFGVLFPIYAAAILLFLSELVPAVGYRRLGGGSASPLSA